MFLMILPVVGGRTKASYAHSTWPLMGDRFIPMGLYDMSPALSALELPPFNLITACSTI